MKLSLLLVLGLVASAKAQSDFHAYAGTENLVENAQIEKLTVVNGNFQFNVRPPRQWIRSVDEPGRKVTFTSPSGQSALTVQFTTNSPATLPAKEFLKELVLRDHPGAAIFNSAVCPTGYRPGVLFDLANIPSPRVVQKIRHAFVAGPDGDVEFVLFASDEEFDQNKLVFMAMLGAFRVDPVIPKQP
jgi:hypothetical protein